MRLRLRLFITVVVPRIVSSWILVPTPPSSVKDTLKGRTGYSRFTPSDIAYRLPSCCDISVISTGLFQSSKNEESSESAAPEKDKAIDDEPDQIQDRLDEKQKEFMIGYLNKHHSDLLTKFAIAFTSVGREMAEANGFSGGSFTIPSVILVDVNESELIMEVNVQRRGQSVTYRTVQFSWNANPVVVTKRTQSLLATVVVPKPFLKQRRPIDDTIRHLIRLCWIVNESSVTGKLIQLAVQLGGSGIGTVPENMYLNQVPNNRYVRQWFYDQCSTAIRDAVLLCSMGQLTNRMKVVSLFPETNPSMDTYRIGTILELVRGVTIRLVEENLRVRICVQDSMGVGIFTGLPKQLSGVTKLLQFMDWQSNPGEANEGMVGEYVRFGAIGARHVKNKEQDADGTIVQHQDDVFLIIAPQSMVGTDTSIIPLLKSHVEAAGDRPIILFNADLTDKISSAGQQSIRGRQERMDFADSFETIFHYQSLYKSGTSYFPILGSATKLHPENPWVFHQRRDFKDSGGEIYVPVLAGETMVDSQIILAAFDK